MQLQCIDPIFARNPKLGGSPQESFHPHRPAHFFSGARKYRVAMPAARAKEKTLQTVRTLKTAGEIDGLGMYLASE
jgi:hypothetical protein